MLISTDGVIRGNIEPISATIRQEINGEYSCNVEIALSDDLAEYFDIDAIVYLNDANGTVQQFRLERPERTLTSLTAFGWHITQDLAHDIIVHKKYTNAEGATVWADLLQSGISETRFTGTADSSAINSLTIVRQSILNALIGDQDNSYFSRWGGEIERNNFTVNMKTQLGENRGYRVAYKKNLTGIHVTVDSSTVVNRVVPTYLNENDAATLLPEGHIDSVRIGDTAVPHAAAVHFGDIRVGQEIDGVVPYPDAASAEAEVRARVADLYASGIDIAMLTVDIEFVQLRNTIEYADYAALEIVRLGDVIGAEYEDYSWTSRIVAYEWDAVLQRYNKLTIGSVRPSASDMSNSIVDAATVAANAAITQRTVELTGAIAAAQTTADGKNTVYYSSTMPTGGTYRVNDIWFDTDDDNKMFLFDGSAWEPVQFGENAIADLAITNAKIADAAINNAKISNLDAGKITTGVLAAERIQIGFGTTFATGYDPSQKRRVFITTPTPPYDVGDLWTDGPSGDIKRCKTARASGSYTAIDWELASKYTDDTIANQALSTADGKNAVFYTASTPPTTNRKVGDVWFDADDNNKMYKWDGTAWTALLLGANSMGTTIIDGGKIVTNLLTANNIRTGTLDASIVTVSNINAGNITAGTLSVDRIAAGTITGTKLADGTVTDVKIASGLSATKITTGKLQSTDGKSWFDLVKPEIVQTAIINNKSVRVEMSPAHPFKLSIYANTRYQDHIYVTDENGFSGPNILVTSIYDVNEDGIVDDKDVRLVTDYMLGKPGTYPPKSRMDVNDSGSVNAIDGTLIMRHSTIPPKLANGSYQIGIDSESLWRSDDWGDTKTQIEFDSGTMTLTTASWTSVSFNKTFPAVPRVLGQYTHDFAGDIGTLKIRSITKTGFQATIGGSGFSGISANWFAILC